MAGQGTAGMARLLNQDAPEAIKDNFIVNFKPGTSLAEREDHERQIHDIAKLKPDYGGVGEKWDMDDFHGYHVHMDEADIGRVLESPLVDFAEKDTMAELFGDGDGADVSVQPDVHAERNPSTWGLARISHRAPNPDPVKYVYDNALVDIYVIDTGIRTTHKEFGGRAIWGKNLVPDTPDEDQHGHGTHVAGTAIGATFGVASAARAIAVKVFGPSGTAPTSRIISGLDFCYRNAGVNRPRSVVNMSLGGPRSQSMNNAVNAAARGGMTIVVSAGNTNQNVDNYSPASAASAVTVAAIDRLNKRASFSNWGTGVAVFAHGVDVKSAGHTSDTAIAVMSGTSMSSPHVAGLAAYFILLRGLSGDATKRRIIDSATHGQVVDPRGSPNRIAYNESNA